MIMLKTEFEAHKKELIQLLRQEDASAVHWATKVAVWRATSSLHLSNGSSVKPGAEVKNLSLADLVSFHSQDALELCEKGTKANIRAHLGDLGASPEEQERLMESIEGDDPELDSEPEPVTSLDELAAKIEDAAKEDEKDVPPAGDTKIEEKTQ